MGRAQQKKSKLEVSDIDDDADDPQSTALYGRSGSGKTTLSATWPTPILYLDVQDRGARSISDVKGIKKRRIKTFADFEETYWWLKENPTEYVTVVIDTVTQLQRIVVEEHHKGKRKRGGPDKGAGDWGSMTKGDWGAVAALMKEWIINYRDLVDEGMEVVFIAQDRTFNFDDDDDADPEDGLAPEVGPALSPAVAKLLNASVDIIGNTFIRERTIKGKPGKPSRKEIEYCLRVGPNSVYVTKVRKPKSIEAPSVLVDPDYDSIMAIVEGDE